MCPVMPGDEHISCAHELSLWALHTVTKPRNRSVPSTSLTRDRMPCKIASEVPAKWPRHTRAFPVGLTYSSLAIHDDRYASNEIECLAHEYYNGSRFPARFFSLAISRPLTPVSPIWIMRALEAARTTRGDACTVISKYISNESRPRILRCFHDSLRVFFLLLFRALSDL